MISFVIIPYRIYSGARRGLPNPKHACGRLLVIAAASKRRKAKQARSAKSSSSPGQRVSTRGFGGLKKAPSGARPLRDSAIEALYRYLGAGGASISKVAIADVPACSEKSDNSTLRGVIATQNISSGEVVCAVPLHLAVPLGSEGANPGVAAGQLLRLMAEDNSPFQSVFDVLPSETGLTPDGFSEEELRALQFEPVIQETTRRVKMVASAYHSLRQTLPKLDERRFQWAVWIIVSRVLTIQQTDGAVQKVLIPLIDMFNGNRLSPHRLSCSAGLYKVIAGEDISAGDEIRFAYGGGKLGSDRTLQDYGYVELDDPNFDNNLGVLLRAGGCRSSRAPTRDQLAALTRVEQMFTSTLEADQLTLTKDRASLSPEMVNVLRFRLSLQRTLETVKKRLVSLPE